MDYKLNSCVKFQNVPDNVPVIENYPYLIIWLDDKYVGLTLSPYLHWSQDKTILKREDFDTLEKEAWQPPKE